MATTMAAARASAGLRALLLPARRQLSTHVSVIGLHWKTDETRLRHAFEPFGTLEEAQVFKPEHSSTHLWASLVYATFDEALSAASEMNGQELDGRLLRVSIVDPPVAEDAAARSAGDAEPAQS